MKKHTLAGAAAATILLTPLAAHAATEAELDELIVTARFLKHRYEEQQQTITALQKRVAELEQQLGTSLAMLRGRGVTPGSGESQPMAQQTAQAIGQVNSGHMPQLAQAAQTLPSTVPAAPGTQQSTTQEQAVATTQGVPLFDRKFTIEQGLTYTHWDRRSLALSGFLALDSILLGQIRLQQIKTDQLQYDFTARWNATDRLSVDLNVPLIYRTASYASGGAGGAASTLTEMSSDTTSVGDINFGLYYQLPKDSPTDLDWIASVRVKAPTGRHPFGIKLVSAADNTNLLVPTRQPTGNGVWNTTVGLSVLRTVDPIVLFGNVGIGYNFERGFSDLSATAGAPAQPGDVKLGNTFSFGAGFALALNEKTSVSFSYSQLFQQAARLRAVGGDWVRQVGSDVNSATFNSSLTYQLSPRLSMVGTVSMGLTPDAPDYSIGIKFPYRF